jgi:hypothetical protein
MPKIYLQTEMSLEAKKVVLKLIKNIKNKMSIKELIIETVQSIDTSVSSVSVPHALFTIVDHKAFLRSLIY